MRPSCLFLFILYGLAVPHALAAQTERPGGAAAEEIPATRDKSGVTVLFYFENDLFYNEDRYYINAVQLRLISPDLSAIAESPILPDSVSGVLNDIPFPGSADASQFNVSLGSGQQIYTPEDTQAENPDPNDRPYAGYLYGLLALHAKKYNRLDTVELAAGIIGPSALGEWRRLRAIRHGIISVSTFSWGARAGRWPITPSRTETCGKTAAAWISFPLWRK